PALPLVLLAEDNDELARYLALVLRGLCRLRRARDGRELVERARREPPALVLSDVMMPGLDGLAACRALKEDPATARVPVVLVTALTDRASMLRGWEAGADEYLFKPFHPEEVRTRVRTLLEAVRSREEARAALEVKTAELERSNAELEQFAFVASHDLQEPLRKVVGFCELLEQREAGRLEEESLDCVRRAAASARRMQDMVRGLLALARAARPGEPPAPVDAARALAQALEDLQGEVARTGASVTSGPLPTVLARGPQVSQLFENLVANALKFRGERPCEVRVEARRDGKDGWVFSVRDNGIGIDPRYAERVFGVFERLHPRGRYPGSGIGLAICRKIVESQGGRIWVESAPGAGATFYFTLPAAEAA
ncbi:MAG: response regulator, partial [Elusimicrobia bacterium]|nr:response regulator [Elusimicrobiota bacterium]